MQVFSALQLGALFSQLQSYFVPQSPFDCDTGEKRRKKKKKKERVRDTDFCCLSRCVLKCFSDSASAPAWGQRRGIV